MTYTVHVSTIGEVCRVPSGYYAQASQWFAVYADAGYSVSMFCDGLLVRRFEP